MKVAIGCDPNAKKLKNEVALFLKDIGHDVTDFGSDDPIYANVAIKVAEAVANEEYERGILICGTGIGMMIAANKVNGAYAANVTDVYSAIRACLSNNCNIITLGSQTIGNKLALELVDAYFTCRYVYNKRSGPKVDAIVEYEKKHIKK